MCLDCCVWSGLSVFWCSLVPFHCGGFTQWVGLDDWFAKVSWLGKLASVFWCMELDFFSLLLKTMGCFSGCPMSSARGQKLFCEVCSAFKCSFDEFVGYKVVSPSYSSAILAPQIDAFELWCWRRLLRVPWTARRSNQSILKEISAGCSLEGLMLKLKLHTLATSCEELTHWKRP